MFTVTRLDLSAPPSDCKRFSTASKDKRENKKKQKKKKKKKIAIGHQRYKIDKPVISTFFHYSFIDKNNDLMTANCAFALKYKDRKTEIRNE